MDINIFIYVVKYMIRLINLYKKLILVSKKNLYKNI